MFKTLAAELLATASEPAVRLSVPELFRPLIDWALEEKTTVLPEGMQATSAAPGMAPLLQFVARPQEPPVKPL